MTKFVITYLGGNQPSTAEEGQQHFARYRQWLSSLGDSAISPANPLTNTQTVNPDGSVTAGGSTAMSGFTILEAESMDAALVAPGPVHFLKLAVHSRCLN